MAVVVSLNMRTHDAGAAIVKDGRLVAAALEERFSRQKHDRGLPRRSLAYCLAAAGVSPAEVDHWVFPYDDRLLARATRKTILRSFGGFTRDPFRTLGDAYIAGRWASRKVTRALVTADFRNTVEQGSSTGFDAQRMQFVPHHAAHADGAFVGSGFHEAAVLVADGRGEIDSTTVWRAGASSDLLHREPVDNSLGIFYSAMTGFLGWEENEGEGKTMGLAPYGGPRPDLSIDPLLHVGATSWRVQAKLAGYQDRPVQVERVLKLARRGAQSALVAPYPDVAYAAQDALEKAMIIAARRALELTGSERLCLTGGVALNCKANMKVREAVRPGALYVEGPAGDAGVTVGAALHVARGLGERLARPYGREDWGPEFAADEIEAILAERRVRYTRESDIASAVAERIGRGEIVAWFQGRMELGPRSLGHRAILADPREASTRDRLNRLKGRESWRPLCPSVLAERADEILVDPCDAPFMVLSFRVRPEAQKQLAAAVHVDGTTRPQTVAEARHPLFHRLIRKFASIAGVPAVLNTSFNPAGMPVACTPLHALADFYAMGLDALAIGPFLVTR